MTTNLIAELGRARINELYDRAERRQRVLDARAAQRAARPDAVRAQRRRLVHRVLALR